MLISWQNLWKQFFIKNLLQWLLAGREIIITALIKLLIFHPDVKIWRLKSILDTSKNFKSFLLNKSCVIKEILKYYTDGRLPFPHSLYQPRVVFKRGLCWMVYWYCQFTFQTYARDLILSIDLPQPFEDGGKGKYGKICVYVCGNTWTWHEAGFIL